MDIILNMDSASRVNTSAAVVDAGPHPDESELRAHVTRLVGRKEPAAAGDRNWKHHKILQGDVE
jgi:hypothetical protein